MNERLVRRVFYPLHERLKRQPTFQRLAELERSQWLSPELLAEYQFGRLRSLVEFAYAHVPYYRAILDDHGLTPQRLQSPHDLRDFPFLTREIIRTRFDDLRAHAHLPGVHKRSSGGSTGVPVTVLVDMRRMGFVEAARMRAQRWFDVNVGAREIVLWASPIELTRQDRVRQFRDSWLNSRLLSAFDLGEEGLARYAEVFHRDDHVKMYGYTIVLFLLVSHFVRQSLPPHPRL